MSRYEKIPTEIIEMKELIIAINNRFDQVYKKIDILDEKVNTLGKKIDEMDKNIKLILDKLK